MKAISCPCLVYWDQGQCHTKWSISLDYWTWEKYLCENRLWIISTCKKKMHVMLWLWTSFMDNCYKVISCYGTQARSLAKLRSILGFHCIVTFLEGMVNIAMFIQSTLQRTSRWPGSRVVWETNRLTSCDRAGWRVRFPSPPGYATLPTTGASVTEGAIMWLWLHALIQ